MGPIFYRVIKPFNTSLIIVFFLCINCGGDSFTDATLIPTFYKSHFEEKSAWNKSFANGIDIYIDYSGSMYNAIQSAIGSFEELRAIVIDKNATYYRMGAKPPIEIQLDNQKNDPRVRANYNEPKTLLKEALSQIVGKSKEAIMITDFELDEGKRRTKMIKGVGNVNTAVNLDAWAKKDFKLWLSKGHQIDFFVKRFDGDKRLFLTVFTPFGKVNDRDAFINSFKKGNHDIEQIHFSLSNYNVTTKYESNSKALPQNNPFYDEFSYQEADHFEYYPLLREEFISYVNDEFIEGEKVFIGNLFFENNLGDAFKKLDLEVKISDITESFTNYQIYKEQLEFSEEKETLKYQFQPGVEVNNMFEMVKPGGSELGLKLNPNYDPVNIDIGKMYSVRLLIKNSNVNFPTHIKDLLQWTTSDGNFQVPSLYTSIEGAVSELEDNVEGKTLYTYFLNFL